MQKALKITSFLCSALLLASTTISDASARDFNRSGSYEGGNGRSGTVSTQGTRSGGNMTRNKSVTTQSGKTYNRAVDQNYDPATGTVNRTVTGPTGESRSVTGTGDGSGNRSGSYSTSTGKSGAYTGGTVKNEDGSVTNTGSVTTQSGQTVSRSGTTDYDPSSGTVSRQVTSPRNRSRNISGSVQTDTSQQ